jgi:hypothetical protein
LLEAVIEPRDRIAIEGDNQKQAGFLWSEASRAGSISTRALAQVTGQYACDLFVGGTPGSAGPGTCRVLRRSLGIQKQQGIL